MEKNMDEETKKELDKAIEEDEGAWFIPFPGTTKQLKPGPYRGSDPEWQEYIKFSKDKKLGEKVRKDLAEQVRYICSSDPFLTKHIGTQMMIRRYWLDIDFPISPPPIYQRSGIEITDEYVSWTTMPVDSLTVSRMRQVLWPSVFVQSSLAFWKVLFSQNLHRAGAVLGWETKPQPTYDALVALHKARTANGSNPGMTTVPTTRNPNPAGAHKQPDMINASTTNANPSSPTSKKLNDLETQVDKPTAAGGIDLVKPSLELAQEHMSGARKAFKAKWASTWRPAPADPPRGSITVSGLIEVEAPKAWIVIDVKSHWDPKTKEYDLRSTRFALRRVQPKVQSPKGVH